MARKPLPAAEAPAATFDSAAAAADSAALTVLGTRSAEVAEQYDEGLPYDRSRLVSQARFFMGQSAEAMLEAGKRLVVLKENEPHGEFIEILDRQLSISPRTAQKLMQAAVKYMSPALANASAPTLLALGRTKLLELVTEDDDDLKALAEGGTLAGLDLDDMQAMSSRELRAALLEARKDAAARNAVLEKKNDKIDALAAQLERRAANGDEAEAAALDMLREDTLAADLALARLVATAGDVMDGHVEGAMTLAARQAIDWIAQRFLDAAANKGISIDTLGERVDPDFMAEVLQPAGAPTGKRTN